MMYSVGALKGKFLTKRERLRSPSESPPATATVTIWWEWRPQGLCCECVQRYSCRHIHISICIPGFCEIKFYLISLSFVKFI